MGVDDQCGAIWSRNGVDAGGVDAMWEFVAVDDQLGAVLPAIVLSSSQGMFYLRWSLCPRFDTRGASIAHVLVVRLVFSSLRDRRWKCLEAQREGSALCF